MKNYEEIPKEKHRVLEITRKRGLSLEIKLLIANSDQKFKYITEECAFVLEDLLEAVEKGKNTIEKPQNKALQSKKELEKILEEEEEAKEKIRRNHHEEIKKELKEKGISKKKPFVKVEEKKHLEEVERSKKVWGLRLKDNENLKKKARDYRKSKSEDREEKKKEEENKIKDVKKQKERKFEEFNKKAKEKLVKSQFF